MRLPRILKPRMIKIISVLLSILLLCKHTHAQTPPIRFIDATQKSNLHTYTHRLGSPEKPWIIDAMGSGVAVADYDNDGDDDIYFLNGRPKHNQPDPNYHNTLFRNEGGTFINVTDEAGVGDIGIGMCAAFGDVDNDGWLDLYVGNYGPNVFYHNNGDGTFTEMTEESGLADHGYAAATSFADYDNDGDLDLFLGNYVEFDPQKDAQRRANFHGQAVFLGPLSLPPQWDRLFENDGTGHFHNSAAKTGVNVTKARAMGAAFFDLENDGWLDLYVTNDSTFNHILHNQGNGRFEDYSYLSGGGFSDDGLGGASMGVCTGDYNNDGFMDLYITSYQLETDRLYRNNGDGTLTETTPAMRLFSITRNKVTWGAGFCDFDADGYLDLYTVNGHVYPQVENIPGDQCYYQGISIYRHNGERYVEVSNSALPNGLRKFAGRGSALLDYDQDSDMDIVINCIDSTPMLLENQSPQGNWLQLQLDFPSAQTYGIRVRAHSKEKTWTQIVDGGSGYLSQNTSLLHFGFGEIDQLDKLIIHWHHRKPQIINEIELNQRILIKP